MLAGYARLKRVENTLPARINLQLRETVVWIVQFYETQGMTKEAAIWLHNGGKPSIPLYEEMVKALNATVGSKHPDTLAMTLVLAVNYRESFEYERSLVLFEELWRIRQELLPEGQSARIDAQNQLGLILLLSGRAAEAEPHLSASYGDSRSAKDFSKDWTLAYLIRLISVNAELDKSDEVAHWRMELGTRGGPKESYLYGTGLQMYRASRFRAAEILLRENLDLRERTMTDPWTTFHSKFMLGCALLAQKKNADAEPLLLAGYEGLKQPANLAPDRNFRLSEAAARLVELYEALDDKDQTAKWSKEVETQKELEASRARSEVQQRPA